ncbi:MAG: tetratricopeptide repeat protein [Euryarchaeota archaeon]|nr:tetratricopeptide repeat protein [Euryarchaeota archaeon]MBU4492254.1 tetratricopeptide repeat protein [Euryarchaeota archaeon]
MSSSYDATAALHHKIRGTLYFQKTRYREANEDFARAVQLAPPDDPNKPVYMVDLGNIYQLLRLYDDAERLYNQVLASAHATAQVKAAAEEEIKKLAIRRSQSIADLRADDPRLYSIVHPMLVDYPFLRKPVNLWWINRDAASLKRIADMESKFNVEPHKRVTRIAWTALSHFPRETEHFIFIVRDEWDEANDEELRGMLAHELTHEEWKEVGYTSVIPNPASSAIAFICNERITDLVTISKGYGEALLASRRYQEATKGALEYTGIMSPIEIEQIITSELFLRQSAMWQMTFALELTQKIGKSPLAAEEWRKGAEMWGKVIAVNSTYAFAYCEQGVAYHWLDDMKEAETCYRKAIELDPNNPQYKEKLEKVLRVRESTQ